MDLNNVMSYVADPPTMDRFSNMPTTLKEDKLIDTLKLNFFPNK